MQNLECKQATDCIKFTSLKSFFPFRFHLFYLLGSVILILKSETILKIIYKEFLAPSKSQPQINQSFNVCFFDFFLKTMAMKFVLKNILGRFV